MTVSVRHNFLIHYSTFITGTNMTRMKFTLKLAPIHVDAMISERLDFTRKRQEEADTAPKDRYYDEYARELKNLELELLGFRDLVSKASGVDIDVEVEL